MKKFILIIGTFLTLFGCATVPKVPENKYPIQYDSNPRGASVVCSGITKGSTPLTLFYEPSDEYWKKEVFDTKQPPCEAKWISGVKVSYTNKFDLNRFPNGVVTTTERPNTEGYEEDIEYALRSGYNTEQNVRKISLLKPDMNEEQVIHMMGAPPIKVEFSGKNKAMHYCRTGKSVDEMAVVLLSSNRVVATRNYTVTIVDSGGVTGDCSKFIKPVDLNKPDSVNEIRFR